MKQFFDFSTFFQHAFGSQLRRNVSSGIIRAVGNFGIIALSYPLYLYYLGYESYGVWLILATVLTFAQMGNLGISSAITKLVAEEYGRSDTKGMQSYVTVALAVLSTSGLLIFLVILFFKSQIIDLFGLSAENRAIGLWLLPYIGALSVYIFLVQALNATVMGLGRMDLANYTQVITRILAIPVSLVLLAYGRGVESLLISNFIAYAMIHISSLIIIRRVSNLRFLRAENLEFGRLIKLFKFGGGVFGSCLLSMLVAPFDKLMLSRYAGVATVPVFEIAFQSSVQIRSLLESGLHAIMPEISRLSGEQTAEAAVRIKTINRKAFMLILTGGVLVYTVLLVGAKILLKVWLGERYLAEIPPAFRVMLVCTFFSLLGVPAFHSLMGLGKVRYCFLTSVIIAGGNFVLVMIVWLLTGYISVLGLGLCLTVCFAASTVYCILKARAIVNSLGKQHKIG